MRQERTGKKADDREIRKICSIVLARAKRRCNVPSHCKYKYYGGRGIRCLMSLDDVINTWKRDKAWRLEHPSIDRINNNGNYEKSNIRFIEFSQNRPHGIIHHSAVANQSLVKKIRKYHLRNKPMYTEGAKKFNISWDCYHDIVTKETWKWV